MDSTGLLLIPRYSIVWKMPINADLAVTQEKKAISHILDHGYSVLDSPKANQSFPKAAKSLIKDQEEDKVSKKGNKKAKQTSEKLPHFRPEDRSRGKGSSVTPKKSKRKLLCCLHKGNRRYSRDSLPAGAVPHLPPQEGFPSHAGGVSGWEIHPMFILPHVFHLLMDQLSRALRFSLQQIQRRSDRSQQEKNWQNVCKENKKALHRLWGLHITEQRTEDLAVFSGIRCEQQDQNGVSPSTPLMLPSNNSAVITKTITRTFPLKQKRHLVNVKAHHLQNINKQSKSTKDLEIQMLQLECEELKNRLRCLREGLMGQKLSNTEELLKQSQKELLCLQRQLSLISTGSPMCVFAANKTTNESFLA
ncbi:uncharacterized protein LOC116228299 [Phasianus colchicus]|uniref:uncharacterized protein LOC116228299 n=1 Tax=Phasianus colchicus TaxID=9054 RepID=UPI00129E43E2|nr:uncharacterized protein LOC116228299 [Phasianus colchicus]